MDAESFDLELAEKGPSDVSAALVPALVAPTAPRARKRGWLVIGAGAALALAAVFALPERGTGEESRAPATPETNELEAESLAAAPTESPPVAPPAAESAAPPPAAVEGPAAAASAASVPAAAAVPAPAAPAVVDDAAAAVRNAPPGAPVSPVAYDEKALEGALRWGITSSEACHRGGRPVGTARAILTFGPAGKILQAELEGEPIASAPVSRCILPILRSMMIPAFPGPEFTITREITLR